MSATLFRNQMRKQRGKWKIMTVVMGEQQLGKIQFDADATDGLEVTRAIVLERLRKESHWNQYDITGEGFDKYVDYVGDKRRARERLILGAQEILWELMIQGVITPGLNVQNPNLPWFRLTEYGGKVVATGEYLPHDPTGYLARLHAEIKNIDATVEAYLKESLNCFERGNYIASVVMLGISSERVFLQLCTEVLNAIQDAREKEKFNKILKQNAIKPKLDWLLSKFQGMENGAAQHFPDNVNIMLAAIFDFIRCQRNDLGHPRDRLPKVAREDAFVNLRLFPSYVKTAGDLAVYFNKNRI